MTVSLSSVSDALASQFGGLQDPCTAGGALCPQPQSWGASFNPCCWSSAVSGTAQTDAEGNAVPVSSVNVALVIGAAVLGLFLVARGIR